MDLMDGTFCCEGGERGGDRRRESELHVVWRTYEPDICIVHKLMEQTNGV